VGKRYDRAYFDRWYRGAGRLEQPAELRRKVAMVVAIAERFLERPLASALDVGCGEGRWRAELRRLRPRLRYVGVEPSEYAVARFGRRRGLVRGGFAELSTLGLGGPFDLVVCADVLHYLADEEIDRGLPALVALMRGAAYLELLTSAEEVEGDRRALWLRPPAFYADRFRRAGLAGVGCHVWLATALADRPSALELRAPCAAPGRGERPPLRSS
jgi:SAM-dependent methyltransferase